MARALDDARPRDEKELAVAELVLADADGRAHQRWTATFEPAAAPSRSLRCSALARTKSAKSGWGASGFDWNSGWYCTATYHGCSVSSATSTNLPSGVLPEIVSPACV